MDRSGITADRALKMKEQLDQLVVLSREVGRPECNLVVLSEGNTSTLLDDRTFLVKSSGARLADAEPKDFARLRLDPLLEAVQDPEPVDVRAVFAAARADPSPGIGAPSIETFLHVVCLGLAGAHFAIHTHPTSLVGLLCSVSGKVLLTSGPLFPDEVVVCGPAPLYVPYTEPGLALARAVVPRLHAYTALHGEPPKTIYLENHGLFALGASATEALAVTQMAVKAARVRAATAAAGGPRPLAPGSVADIAARGDELERRRLLADGAP
jgi:rhamnose utilization protein RhaD (predicted bifunctional aldolase and dehydrogenase)